MRVSSAILVCVVFVGGSLLRMSIAQADAIDGNWCSAEGRHIAIAGSAITTPGGSHLAGDYARHAFSYVAPSGEEGAGALVLMRLLNEEEVRITFPPLEPVIWHRCKLETS